MLLDVDCAFVVPMEVSGFLREWLQHLQDSFALKEQLVEVEYAEDVMEVVSGLLLEGVYLFRDNVELKVLLVEAGACEYLGRVKRVERCLELGVVSRQLAFVSAVADLVVFDSRSQEVSLKNDFPQLMI